MDMQDKERAEKIRETLGDTCGIVELQRVSDDDAIQWAVRQAASQKIRLSDDAARELVDALGAEMLTLQSELSKLILYAESQNSSSIELADVETMVSAAKQRSLYELTDAISGKDAPRAVALLHGLLNASEGGEDAAIGHIFSLAKTFRQMLVLNEKQVRDQRAIWQVLWPGFRVAPFAADALIAQARRYRDRSELTRGIDLIARADAELRSNPADKRLVLERLVLRLATTQSGVHDRLTEA
jgi:DNA polymerase-3 subunit delta